MPSDFGVESTVGRVRELEQIEAVFDGLVARSSACLTVEGEPGIGKTHLLTALHRGAEERGSLVLSGSATEFERDQPFSVWIDALDAYVASQELGLAELWSVEQAGELAAVIPAARPTGGAVLGSVADERYRAHRAVRKLLELLAAERPAVIILDDLHWCDEASIELLAALLRREADAPVLLALAFRPGQAPPRLLAALAVPSVHRIVLDPLSEAQAIQLLGELDARTSAAIYRQGGGNPFYLEQLRRAGKDGLSKAVAGSESGTADTTMVGVPVPAAVAASLAEEIGSLTSDQRSVLRAAAVTGEPFEPDLAAAVAELTELAGLNALDALLALDLVRPTAVPRRFVFRHPLVRRAVYESTPAGWRLAAHARAAATLAVRGAAASERAHHLEQCAVQGDEIAIAVFLEAGAGAATRAPAAAARWFDAALRLLPATDSERQVDVRVALSSSLRSLGELDRCRMVLLEAMELLGPDDVARRVELTTQCAGVEHRLGRHGEAHRRLTRAWEDVTDRSTAEAAVLEIELTIDGLYELAFEQATEMGGRALATARDVGDRALIASAFAALCLAETLWGRVDVARPHREQAAVEIDQLSDAELAPRLDALFHLAWAEIYLEHYDEALEHIDRGIAIARSFGESQLLMPLALAKNFPFEVMGRLAEAQECCETAVEAARLSASPHELYRALFELGWTRYFSGDLDGAIAAYEECSLVDPRLAGATIPNGGGGPGWGLGVALFDAGEIDRGRSLLLELTAEDVVRTMPVERCFDWESLTLVELAAGDVVAASAYADRAENDAAELGLMLPAALAGRARASVLLAQGESLTAARVAHDSASAAATIGARLHVALGRSIEGRALAAAGERAQAITVLRAAEQELDACGSLRVRDEVRRELRRLGARAESRGPAAAGDSGIGSLTKRELEIATLATDRMTNREIATALFLSDKTVESHMRHIFQKLGVSSRVEVARFIERARREQDG